MVVNQSIDFVKVYYKPVSQLPKQAGVKIGTERYERGTRLDFGEPFGTVDIDVLLEAVLHRADLTNGSAHPQLAFYLCLLANHPAALDTCFPLTKSLDAAARDAFHDLIRATAAHPHFAIRLIGERRSDLTAEIPRDAVYLVAGHLAETFFYRRDILERLLSTPRRFWLYSTPDAFKQDGGAAGGSFNPKTGALQLVLSRLYEGFRDPQPGVAPFLHEFGHMLDFFDAARGDIGQSRGLLPGMRLTDGAIYTPEARERFVKGKRLELERYLKRMHDNAAFGDLLPIGHPYVFHNDTEFIAGYFEMFFRNPHYFAAQNPDLYDGFASLFRQDTRKHWERDFPFYIQQNRDFYLKSGQRPSPTRLTIPD